jgi:hypothetical protein
MGFVAYIQAAGTNPRLSRKVVKVNTGNEKLRSCHLNVLDRRYYDKAKKWHCKMKKNKDQFCS